MEMHLECQKIAQLNIITESKDTKHDNTAYSIFLTLSVLFVCYIKVKVK